MEGGKFRPPLQTFWVEEEDRSVKNHLFIFKLVGNVVKPVWQSSNLDRPNYELWLSDVNGDGENELVTWKGGIMLIASIGRSVSGNGTAGGDFPVCDNIRS